MPRLGFLAHCGGHAARTAARRLPATRTLRGTLLLLAVTACAPAPQPQPQPQPQPDAPPPVEREFRGVWIASVANLDWPSRPGLPAEVQRAELLRMFDRARELGLNAVILQVRPAADALYASSLEPWSEWLTGEQGRAPEPYYDPLAFAVEEAHARGLELHAWFNPYRAVHPAARGPLAANHISRTHPELVPRYGQYGWMDPGADAVLERSLDVIRDVVRRYDIDGVHVDDYFYPYREAGPDGRELDFPDSISYARYVAGGGTLDRSHWRRWNVDRFVAGMYEVVKSEKPWVKVGVSPIGTWRPNVVPQLGGFDAYEQIYADARKWILDGDLDYLVPQLYWPISRVDVSFPVLLDWWARQNPHGRALYSGLIPDRVNLPPDPRLGWPPEEVLGQIYVTRAHAGAHGHVHFRMGSLMSDGALRPIADTLPQARVEAIRSQQLRVQARRDSLTSRLRSEAYVRPALVPAMPWLDAAPPPAPNVSLRNDGVRTVVDIAPAAGEPAFLWVVQSRTGGTWRTDIVPARTREWVVAGAETVSAAPDVVWVSAVDRTGNQSAPVRAVRSQASSGRAPRIIPGSAWRAQPPVGYVADGVRRNLPHGGALTFRDLEITVLATKVDSTGPGEPHDAVQLRLSRGDRTESMWVPEGAAFNWNDYHVAVVAVYGPGELGAGLTAIEVATLASVPAHIARSRTAGGAALRLRVPHEITHVTLHHTGSAEPLRAGDDPVQRLRGLQGWGERERNWWDVPYHYLIDLDGNIYQGRDWRYTGETNTTYNPAGHFLISVIGNYELQRPMPAQLDAITALMAWAIRRFELPLDRIGGHYDYAQTTCPGTHLRGLLEDGTLLRLTASRL